MRALGRVVAATAVLGGCVLLTGPAYAGNGGPLTSTGQIAGRLSTSLPVQSRHGSGAGARPTRPATQLTFTTYFGDRPQPRRFIIDAVIVLGIALGLQRTLRLAWRRRGRRSATTAEPAGTVPAAAEGGADIDIDGIRRSAEQSVTSLATRLAKAPARVAHRTVFDEAVAAREAAEPLLESAAVLDVVGALVLGRSGLHDLTRASQPDAGTTYHCCFFNPLHGAASGESSFALGDTDREVRVCNRCAADLKAGRAPDALAVRPRRHARPYYEGADLWARTGFGSLVDHLGSTVLEERADPSCS